MSCDGVNGDEAALDREEAISHRKDHVRAEGRQADDVVGSSSCALCRDLDCDLDFQVCCHACAHGRPTSEG